MAISTRLLTNPLVIGRIRHHDEVYPGQHSAIVEQALWDPRIPLAYALTPEAGGAVVEVAAEAPSPIAVAFKLAAADAADLAPGRWRWSLLRDRSSLETTLS